ncbi:ABC transporter [Alkalihalobacillus alcalophilus ATCC 27647 = CGMCC 1.3604]|uniref:ABC transporter n=1 Tax=Alkalihalobacillus alcalophilus ATCC 27647 = CGMCC 1.3604 TaxID=1218173 RepID=J8Q6U8_ALKAL|nr:sugar ABC transporter ATP-binding protein [Alkalihalobacillus alcalophilus]AFV25878.1 sugar transporter [Alkalihalobacillus alcalophilus ATCC 27647 = CGMCC 1.3604]KGA96548.1 ABC transporter [Alkalihalobacillus alcalophilus ATCC 27647 = CGMCC 1.3604]MED1564144.1 sugar ABC transporter ATP-binding protein [Alkalihalobacillus alcalophilus]THG91845.1 ABC transporter [Alkalihalobacillus alcalophilus ATCC 27647 = CGMCC 1.3604]
MKKNVIEMKQINIEFPGVKALDSVDFFIESGVTHALIGANGAGKSTLMKVLSGAYTHYDGTIKINGKEVTIRSPKDAQSLGIQIVYQEVDTALIPYLSVAENVMMPFLIHKMAKSQLINWKKIHAETKKVLESINVFLSTEKLISDLTLAEKQMVLIARALTTDCRFLLLDEPTAPLSQTETEQLFHIVRHLNKQSVGVIFISHRLPEIFQLCEKITIMRSGRKVITEKVSETNENRVVEQMLGRKLEEQFPYYRKNGENIAFEVMNFSDDEKIKDIHFSISKGEIIGIAGLVGAGKTELCKALFGEAKTTGKIRLNGKELNVYSPYDAVKAGIALVPEERRKEGLLIDETVEHNLSVANLRSFTNRFHFLLPKKENTSALSLIESLGIKTPSPKTKAEFLSGGNQQKIAIGKWLIADCDVYIFDEPTKGVDVGAKKDIFNLIIALANRGKMIIYASAELAEVLGITERIYVMYDGQIVTELKTEETTEEEILYYSAGGQQNANRTAN